MVIFHGYVSHNQMVYQEPNLEKFHGDIFFDENPWVTILFHCYSNLPLDAWPKSPKRHVSVFKSFEKDALAIQTLWFYSRFCPISYVV